MSLFLIRGLPGSGKSTLAATLSRKDKHGVHIETDMFFVLGGEYKFDASKLKEAHLWAQDWCRKELRAGSNCYVSNTFSMKWEMQPYLDMAKMFGQFVFVMECQGNYENVHNVPAEVIERMKERWEKVYD